MWCRYWLSVNGMRVTDALYAMQRINLNAPELKTKLRLAVLLKNEIQKRLLSVDETQKMSKVVLKGDSTFLSGATTVQPEMARIIERVAQEVRRVNGDVVIVGHTDSTPINKPDLPNNKVLSLRRTREVARYSVAAGIPPEKVKAIGADDSQPVATNATAQRKMQNRCVEFFYILMR